MSLQSLFALILLVAGAEAMATPLRYLIQVDRAIKQMGTAQISCGDRGPEVLKVEIKPMASYFEATVNVWDKASKRQLLNPSVLWCHKPGGVRGELLECSQKTGGLDVMRHSEVKSLTLVRESTGVITATYQPGRRLAECDIEDEIDLRFAAPE